MRPIEHIWAGAVALTVSALAIGLFSNPASGDTGRIAPVSMEQVVAASIVRATIDCGFALNDDRLPSVEAILDAVAENQKRVIADIVESQIEAVGLEEWCRQQDEHDRDTGQPAMWQHNIAVTI